MISRAARVLCIAAVLCAVCAFGAQLLMEVDAQREDAAGANIGLGILMLLLTPMPWIVGSAAFVASAEALARSAEAQAHSPISVALSFLALGCVLIIQCRCRLAR